MGKWSHMFLSKWPYFLSLGILWLFWQLFLDELASLIREHISGGGLIMYSAAHPYVIMPSLLILFGIYTLIQSKRKLVKEGKLQIELQDCVTSLSFIPQSFGGKNIFFGTSVVEATAKFRPAGAIKLDFLGLHLGAHLSQASHLPIGLVDREATYAISFECPNSVLNRACNTHINCYLEAKSGDTSWRSNDCPLSLGIARQYAP